MYIVIHPHGRSTFVAPVCLESRGAEPTVYHASTGTTSPPTALLSNHERYTQATNTWDSRTLVGSNRGGLTGASFDGKGYQSGGFSNPADPSNSTTLTHSEYNFGGNSWTARADMPALPTTRHQIAASNDQLAYMRVGGFSGTFGHTAWHRFSTGLVWVLQGNQAAFQNNWDCNGFDSLGNGNPMCYMILGSSTLLVVEQRRLYRFNYFAGPAIVELTGAPLPDRRQADGFICQGCGVDVSKGNMIGGLSAGVGRVDNDEYSQGPNTWVSRQDKTTSTRLGALERAGGKIYVGGGFGTAGAASLAVHEEYTPGTNSWATKTAMGASGHARGRFSN